MINGKITKLKNKNGEVTFPITSSQAVMMSDGLTSVEDAINNISVSGNAEGTSFDNSSNGMTATNVQEAIEENKTSILSLQEELGTNKSTLEANINSIREVL